jgi:mannose-6-phosphate isomerase-like protein (cupin superfamily)
MSMRKSFKKSVGDISIEQAHWGSGSRKLLLSSLDDISSNLEAMTQGFLPVWNVFDWHLHYWIDEFFFVTQGTGRIEFRDSQIQYMPDDLIYIPAHTEHRIIAEWDIENQFYFVRVKNPHAND